MTEFQVKILTEYIVNKIVYQHNNNNSPITDLVKEQLKLEISARLCIMSSDITFNELVSAIEEQVSINNYIN